VLSSSPDTAPFIVVLSSERFFAQFTAMLVDATGRRQSLGGDYLTASRAAQEARLRWPGCPCRFASLPSPAVCAQDAR